MGHGIGWTIFLFVLVWGVDDLWGALKVLLGKDEASKPKSVELKRFELGYCKPRPPTAAQTNPETVVTRTAHHSSTE